MAPWPVASYEKFMWPGTLTVRLRSISILQLLGYQNIAKYRRKKRDLSRKTAKVARYHDDRDRSPCYVQGLNLKSVGASKQEKLGPIQLGEKFQEIFRKSAKFQILTVKNTGVPEKYEFWKRKRKFERLVRNFKHQTFEILIPVQDCDFADLGLVRRSIIIVSLNKKECRKLPADRGRKY